LCATIRDESETAPSDISGYFSRCILIFTGASCICPLRPLRRYVILKETIKFQMEIPGDDCMFEEWQRLEQDGIPVYVQPEKPDWFVPDHEADCLLQELQEGKYCGAGKAGISEKDLGDRRMLATRRLVSQLAAGPVLPYSGRHPLLALNRLKECWFHLTDRCNLACRHCLFSSSPAQAAAISPEALARGIAEARALGCTLFYFTGGEPFVYPGFVTMAAELLADPEIHVVVLSNGLLIGGHLAGLSTLPRERFHLQISMDGLAGQHEQLRGKGTFAGLLASLAMLKEAGFPLTLSVAVNRANVMELAEIVAFAAGQGIGNVHLLWHFVRGKGSQEQFVAPARILPELIRAQEMAEKCGVRIDNVESLRSQVFSTPGTRHDLSNTAWESLAVGPDELIYPSPALVGLADLACGALGQGLETVWRQSPVLENIRQATLAASEAYRANPLRFLVGGGDIDHSYLAGGALVGHDPYVELYNGLALWLISKQARRCPARAQGELLLRMGEVRFDCPNGGEVALTHCNCVVSLADDTGHSSVREFYGRAALTANEEIVNPFAPDQALANFIPADSRKKSYGCGSPVKDAEPQPGEVLVDLGSGSGVECFMAAAQVGPSGRVIGIDMTEEMLHLAAVAKATVAARLGYDNVEFRKGFLEDIPLPDSTADVVISNCVINLSPDKRQTLHEIFRILKPGGRLVVSDIVTDDPIPAAIRNNERFRGECLGGALRQEDLLAMLRGAGFSGASLIKRFPYRSEGETRFHSLTFRASKPAEPLRVEVIYRGPFAAAWTESGVMLLKGRRATVELSEAESLADCLFVLDAQGGVANLSFENSCCEPQAGGESPLLQAGGCCGGGQEQSAPGKIVALSPLRPPVAGRHQSGCMACGREIGYLAQEREVACHYCGGVKKTNALCVEGHYICDACHQQDGLSAIRLLCLETKEQDMLLLLDAIRRHPAIPLHGPEHHAMVPGIILATYRNLGGKISREAILTGIERGSKVPGGVCGFWGNCGAAAGVGIAFSVLLEATPLTPQARQQVQEVTSRVLGEIAHTQGARCCQRETVTALREAALLSRRLLPVSLLAEADFFCRQFAANRECIGKQCPLWSKTELRLGGAQ
jgi:7,8-dihydro-6-hydroxymethylpterin dimethyltransferase